jgi:hypothetical protein
LGSQLESQSCSQLDSQLDSQLYSQLHSQLYSQLYSQLDSQLGSQLDSQFHSQLQKYNDAYLFTANIYSNVYAAFYKFINDEFKIDAQIGVMLNSWNDLYQKSGVYSAIFSELICVVCKYPKRIYVDEEKRMHNPKGYAVEWGYSTDLTKFECYYIHGRNVPKEVFEKCMSGKITKKDFIGESNEEIKAAIYEILGQEKIMQMLGASEIDKGTFVHANGEIEEVVLYKTKEKFPEIDNNPLAWVKFTCPSTGTHYLIDVPPHFTDAKKAAISTSPLFESEEEYKFDFRS